MMKQKWVRPKAMVQVFMPNEYVAACYETYNATIECVYPGTSTSKYNDTTANAAGEVDKDQWYWEGGEGGIPHGRCGIPTSMTVKKSTLSGTETNGSVIYDIQGWTGGAGTFNVNWVSYDYPNKTGNCYHHKGRLIVSSAGTNRS